MGNLSFPDLERAFPIVKYTNQKTERKKIWAQLQGRMSVPTLVMHGEDDQIVPIKDSAKRSAKLIKGSQEIYYPGAPHGLTATHADRVNSDLLEFLQQGQRTVRKAAQT